MNKNPRISIILCTLNEAGHILDILDDIAQNFQDFEIVLVDDNSSDGTFRLVLDYSKEHSYVRPYQRVGSRGLAGALQSGINLTRGDVICWLDADFSHPVSSLKKMVDQLDQGVADVVVGSRFLPGSQDFTVMNSRLVRLQKRLGLLLVRLGRLFLHPDFHDWTSGFIAMKRKSLDGIRLRGQYGEYFMEFIFQCYQKKLKILEIPFISPPRRSGQSKTAPNLQNLTLHGSRYLLKMARLFLLRFRVGHERSA